MDLTGGRGVTTGASGSVQDSLVSLTPKEHCARGIACVKAKEGLQTRQTPSKAGVRWVAQSAHRRGLPPCRLLRNGDEVTNLLAYDR